MVAFLGFLCNRTEKANVQPKSKEKKELDLKTQGNMPKNEIKIDTYPRVTAVYKERYELLYKGEILYGKLKTVPYYVAQEEFPTTGDYVDIKYNPYGDSQILRTLPRKTFFSRRNPDLSRGEQVIAANFDYVFILQSMNQDFNEKRLERYLTLAWESGASPVLLLTKADLSTDPEIYVQRAKRIVTGVDIHVISSKTKEGLHELHPYLSAGKTVVLLGSSGVGKSSLVNAVADEKIMKIGAVREDDSKGRHTTTHRQLIVLQSGAMIIDTPGMRELGMWDVTKGLDEAFGDVEELMEHCRFNDCHHESEPGCAIKKALQSGQLSPSRWESYCKLKKEAQYAERKEDFIQKKKQKELRISKTLKQIKSQKRDHEIFR